MYSIHGGHLPVGFFAVGSCMLSHEIVEVRVS